VGALRLAEFARQRHDGEAALEQLGGELADGLARRAEHQRAAHLEIAQHVDDGAFDIIGRDREGAVVDVGMGLAVGSRDDAHGVALVAPCEIGDVLRDGGGEHQSAALRGRGIEQKLEVLAKAEVEHLVGLVEHHGAQGRGVEVAALQMVAQPPGGADDDVGALGEVALLAAGIHAADA
jgi:hypothetical protein